MLRPLFLIVCSFVSVLALQAAPECSLALYDLRVDHLSSPLGIDSPAPRFSWKLRGARREFQGARQTAWQLRVGTASGGDDLWDTGQIASPEQLNLRYSGRALHAHQKIFWQVRVWDEQGVASPWSEPTSFTMGVPLPEDWSQARWITDPELVRWRRAKLGYSSPRSADAHATQWLQLDLGTVQPIERVRFHALRHTVPEHLGFPQRFKLEAADEASFASPQVLADFMAEDYGSPWSPILDLPTPAADTRYLRITAPQLRVVDGDARLTFAQVEVLSAGKNVARQATVTASESLEDSQFTTAAVVDGLAVPHTNARANSTLLLRREFNVRPGLRRALLHASGLGHYALRINGAAIDAGLLTPGWTDYEKTVLYDTLDLTDALREGRNAAAFELASGMYNVQPGRYSKFVGPFRPLMAIAQLRLEYADGSVDTIVTDAAWKVLPGPTTFAHVFGGEDYDARKVPLGWDRPDFDDRGWTPAVETAGPGGQLRGASAASPAFRTFDVLPPVSQRQLRPGVTVYDLGQNASLMLHLRVRGAAGSRVKVIPAELVSPDGSVNRESAGGGDAFWNYTLAGSAEGEEWRPTFFYHGSRYLQVELTPASDGGPLPSIQTIEGLVAHSDSPSAGKFACSDDLFNRIHTLIRWAQRSNLSHVITDCPHRERLGWLEQYHLNGPALRYEWDLTRLYQKTFQDMASAQQPNGLVPDIAPEYVKFSGGFRDSPEWGSALILAAWQHWVWTGDDSPLRDHYDAMRRYVDYLASKSQDHLVSHGLGDWYDVGPKRPGVAQLTPIPLTATAIYYEDVVALARIAELLGRRADADELSKRAEQIKAAFNAKFFDRSTGSYAAGSQTSQSMPLVLGLVPEERRAAALEALVADVHRRGDSVSAGDVGYRYLLRALADHGRSDVIFAINHQSEKPGYGYQLAHGATSLTEAWDARPSSSQNHFMLGQLVEWFYGDLAGLAPDPTAPGFGRVIVKPQPVAGIDWARARYESPRGPIAVEWRRVCNGIRLELEIPPNSSARVTVPVRAGEEILVNERSHNRFEHVKSIGRTDVDETLEVSSGHYVFDIVPRAGNSSASDSSQ